MSVLLFRVDERLIHGQVVVGWGAQLDPDRIIVVDDELAASSWEQELYCLGLPTGVSAAFESVADARAHVQDWRTSSERIMVLTRNVMTMVRLAREGRLRGADINIGGIHHAPDRREVLPYLYLSADDAAALRELDTLGARVSARDLPGSRPVELPQLLEGGPS